MNRKVILINGYSENKEEEIHDNSCLNSYYKYFKGNSGGAYDNDEIIIFKQPDLLTLKNSILTLQLDFAILVLIGHGATTQSNQLFKINKNEVIKAGQLELEVDKQLFLVESCRNIQDNISTVDLSDKLPKFRDGGMIRNPLSRDLSKKLYNEEIEKCCNGITVCLACSIHESAWNYYFSNSMIQTSFNWHLSSQIHKQTLGIKALMNIVKLEVSQVAIKEIKKEQVPEIIGVEDFPFSVSKF